MQKPHYFVRESASGKMYGPYSRADAMARLDELGEGHALVTVTDVETLPERALQDPAVVAREIGS